MVGNNASGNPNVARDTKGKQTGAKTTVGKVKQFLKRNVCPDAASIIFKLRAEGCNSCPLRPKEITKFDRKTNETYIETLPGKCAKYQYNGKCVVSYKDHVNQMNTYFNYLEKFDSLKLQETLAIKTLENAELCKTKEILETSAPGFYTHKFMELATENLSNYNKIVHGEINKNLNVSMDMTEAVINAWKTDDGNLYTQEGSLENDEK